MKFEIKNRWTGAVQFECELSAEVAGQSYSLQLGFAARKAIEADANLADANLAGANLAGAYLERAYLAGANLAGAYLAGAYLERAYLAGAYLAGAYLERANLADANLERAYLAGAKLTDSLTLVGTRPYMQIGPIGSRCAQLQAYLTNDGIRLRAGCFFGTRDEFLSNLERDHGDNEHAREYRVALALIDLHAELWTPAVELEAAA